jgi:hypothetical protein
MESRHMLIDLAHASSRTIDEVLISLTLPYWFLILVYEEPVTILEIERPSNTTNRST